MIDKSNSGSASVQSVASIITRLHGGCVGAEPKLDNRKNATVIAQPTQTMRQFFAREDVKALQNIQKQYHWTRTEHKKATAKIKMLAVAIGASVYFEDEV